MAIENKSCVNESEDITAKIEGWIKKYPIGVYGVGAFREPDWEESLITARNEEIFGFNELGPQSVIFDWTNDKGNFAEYAKYYMPKPTRVGMTERVSVRDISGYNTGSWYYVRPFLDKTYYNEGPIQKIITVAEWLKMCMRDHLKPIMCPMPVIPRHWVKAKGNAHCTIHVPYNSGSQAGKTTGSTLVADSYSFWSNDAKYGDTIRIDGVDYIVKETTSASGWNKITVTRPFQKQGSVTFTHIRTREDSCIGWWGVNGWYGGLDSGFYGWGDLCKVGDGIWASPYGGEGESIDKTEYLRLVDVRVKGILDAAKALPEFAGKPKDAAELVDTWVLRNEDPYNLDVDDYAEYLFETFDQVYQTFLAEAPGVLPKFHAFESWSNASDHMTFYESVVAEMQRLADAKYGESMCPWSINTIKTHWYEYGDAWQTETTVKDLLNYWGFNGKSATGGDTRTHMDHCTKYIIPAWEWRLNYDLTKNSTIGIGEFSLATTRAAAKPSKTGEAIPTWAGAFHIVDVLLSMIEQGISHIHLMNHLGKEIESARLSSTGIPKTHGLAMGFVGKYYGGVPLPPQPKLATGEEIRPMFPNVGIHAATNTDQTYLWIMFINRAWASSAYALAWCDLWTWGKEIDDSEPQITYKLVVPADTPWADNTQETYKKAIFVQEETSENINTSQFFYQTIAPKSIYIVRRKLKDAA